MEPNPELVDFRCRLAIAAPLGAAVSPLEMGGMLGRPWDACLDAPDMRWLQLLVASPVVIWIGAPSAAGALFPVLSVLLSPMIAAAAMSLTSVSMIANALRLKAANL